MPSIQDTERECAALREKAIKDADKVRADADAYAVKARAEADKDAANVRTGAVDEQIKKLMAASPRRVELLQDIKNLEKQKGQLKGELEAHERACNAERTKILRDRDKVLVDAGHAANNTLTKANAGAARIINDAEAYLLRKAEDKARSEAVAAEAERKAMEARERLAAVLGQIREAEADLAALAHRRYLLRNEEANQRNRLTRILDGMKDA